MAKEIPIFFILLIIISCKKDSSNDTTYVQNTEISGVNESDLKLEDYDFSPLWTHTYNRYVYGIIGDDAQRLRMEIQEVKKNDKNPLEYLVRGQSKVKGITLNFRGKITLTGNEEVVPMQFGVDDEYANQGIQSQGVLKAHYEFKEDNTKAHSGVFQGELTSRWYLDRNNQVKYDDIQIQTDYYFNNQFVGTWTNYETGNEKIANWGDYRVPKAPEGFDTGIGEFSPSEKYWNRGWSPEEL